MSGIWINSEFDRDYLATFKLGLRLACWSIKGLWSATELRVLDAILRRLRAIQAWAERLGEDRP